MDRGGWCDGFSSVFDHLAIFRVALYFAGALRAGAFDQSLPVIDAVALQQSRHDRRPRSGHDEYPLSGPDHIYDDRLGVVLHLLGYRLGDKLYKAVNEGRFGKKEIGDGFISLLGFLEVNSPLEQR